MVEAATEYREYETILVLKPDLEDTKVVEVVEKLRKLVEDRGGKSVKFHNWGKKKLAFEVQKQQKGVYVHHLYVAAPALVTEYERQLKILDETLLYQTIRVQDGVDIAARAVEQDVLTPPVREPTRRDRDDRMSMGHHRDDDRDHHRADRDDDDNDHRGRRQQDDASDDSEA